MDYPQYQNDLNKMLEFEIFGEAIFHTAVKYTKSEEYKKCLALATLVPLEHFQTFLKQNNLNAHSHLHMKVQGHAIGCALTKMPWKLAMYLLKHGTQHFIQACERLSQHADQETQMFFEYVLNHEKNIYTFADKESKNKRRRF